VHSLPYAVNCSLLFKELPLLERPLAARRAGFDAVEFWWPFADTVPADKAVDGFTRAITDAGVRLVGLNFAAGDMPAGDRGLVSDPTSISEFRDNVHVVAGIGELLGCRSFNALYGNRVDDVTPEAQDDVALENLRFAATTVGAKGGTVLLEPVSGAPRYPLRTMADVVGVIDRVRADGQVTSIGALADLYHLAANGDEVLAAVTGSIDHVAHVQIADHPGRNEPGTGDLPIEAWLEELQAAGYQGHVSLEYNPATSTWQSLEWLPLERRANPRNGAGADDITYKAGA
jgi:hydroxypyruvate isomerase